jgi:tetratricopeptide (TPR) repeat protein
MTTSSEALATAWQHHQAGRLQQAEQNYRQILAEEPNCAPAWHLLGLIAYQTGMPETAVQNISRALELRPEYAEAHHNLGLIMKEQGRWDEAITCFRRALELNPGNADSHNQLGIAWHFQGKIDEAVACYRRTLELKPDFAEAHNHLGNALGDQRKLDDAVISYRRALELNPNYVEALTNLGATLTDLEQFNEAIVCHRRALELQPEFAEAQNNLGSAFQKQGKLDEAVVRFRRSLELKPNIAAAHVNLGNAYRELGKIAEASDRYRHALELQADYTDAHLVLSSLLLLTGDFEQGWPEYEWRWKTRDLRPRDFQQPVWNGRPLQGETILLHAEQGLGDTIQFIRYAPLVKSRGAIVVVECPPPLRTLLSRCPGVDRLVAKGGALPDFDMHAPLMSLPAILKTTLDTIPATIPYVFPDPALVARWREKLSPMQGLRIGINWHGREGDIATRRRDIPLAQFALLAQVPGVRLINLQRGSGQTELAAARDRLPIVDLGDVDAGPDAFVDTAAIMMNLDLVITSDTSIPHLAGALGVPVWLALRFAADWRWLLNRSDSPWYPTMRLFRQKAPGDWTGVFEEMQTVLRDRSRSTS